MMGWHQLIWLLVCLSTITGQRLDGEYIPQVKILTELFPVSNAQQVSQITWRVLGRTPSEVVYCVSEAPVSQLRFVCLDCAQKNITDMINVLNSAQDLTRNAGFPTVSLKNIDVNPNWTGISIMCQAALHAGTVDSAPVTINVEYLKNIHVVDANGQSPIRIPNQGNVFYVECIRGPDGICQQTGRRKTLRCAAQSNPPPTAYQWLKNGEISSGNGADITIGTEWIGKSIQCSANNGLYPIDDMPRSQAVSIEPYSAARLIRTNFQQVQLNKPFSTGNRIEMNQAITLACLVEGNPRPIVFWRLRRPNGEVVDAACPQGYEGKMRERPTPANTIPNNNNIMSMEASCELHISNYSYSGQYWCAACSYVSLGYPECSPSLDVPGEEILNLQVQGPPMMSDNPPSVEQIGSSTAVITVHYCAEPMPRPPRDIVFTVDSNDLQLTQSWQNFRFDSITSNNSVPNCYFARLQISPVHDGDKSRQIVLKIQNQYGSKQIPISLADLLGDDTVHDSVATIIISVVLSLIAIGVIVMFGVIYCMRRHLCCFAPSKEAHYSAASNTGNLKGVPDQYADNVATSHTFYPDQGMEKPTGLKSSREGLNFCEIDLTDRRQATMTKHYPYPLPLATSNADSSTV